MASSVIQPRRFNDIQPLRDKYVIFILEKKTCFTFFYHYYYYYYKFEINTSADKVRKLFQWRQ